jgi:hypothetical protein
VADSTPPIDSQCGYFIPVLNRFPFLR